MAADFVLTLGGIEFSAFEVPDSIRGGGTQDVKTHKYGGGSRTVDAFGPDDGVLSWDGLFVDDTAEARCQQLDTLRKTGEPVPLDWSSFSYVVVVKTFTWTYERGYQIHYSLELEVVEDLVQPVTGVPPNTDDAANGDGDTSDDLLNLLLEILILAEEIGADDIDLLGLPDLIAAIFISLGALASLSGADAASLNGLQAQIDAAVSVSGNIVAALDAKAQTVGDAGNFVSGADPSTVVASLKSLIVTSAALANVVALNHVLRRMSRNVASVQSGDPVLAADIVQPPLSSSSQQGVTIAASQGNMLYQIAAIVYGDAAGWALLAKANGLRDPLLQSDLPLIVPSYDPARVNDGILL